MKTTKTNLAAAVVLAAALGVVASAPAGQAPAAPPPATDRAQDDHRLERAEQAAERISKEEEGLKKAMDEFRSAVVAFKLNDFDSVDLTDEAGVRVCEKLEAAFKTAAQRARAYQKAMRALRDETERAPEAYRQLAAFYRAEAETTKTPAFKANYLRLADNSEVKARLMQERLKDLDDLMAGKAEKKDERAADVEVVTFLDEGAKFFHNARTFFKANPGSVDATRRKQFKDDLKILAGQCNEFMKLLEAFTEKLKATAVSTDLKAEHERDKLAAALGGPDGPLEKARALRAEVDRLASQQKGEAEVLERTLKGLLAEGRHAQANAALANWQASWQKVDRRYALKPVEVPAQGKAFVTDRAFADGGCHPVTRPGVGAAGYVWLSGRRTPQGLYAEVVEGTLRSGDFLLVKAG